MGREVVVNGIEVFHIWGCHLGSLLLLPICGLFVCYCKFVRAFR